MRNSGYDKTPDVLLDVPFATKDGAIVNWIESKALFGSDENHDKYLVDQLNAYWNRFGSGLVIYWFGYISDLRISSLKAGILIEEAFPDDDQIILMNPAHDIYYELPSDQGCLENLDDHLVKIDGIKYPNVQTFQNNSEDTDSAALISAISKVTKSIDNTKIE